MRHLVKYPDCNATKNLFGGKMLAWIDEGAAMYAACQMRTDNIVTRLVDKIEFRVPVPLGHVCNIYARTEREGRTSLTVRVTVTRKTFNGVGEELVVCETDLVFVALDENGKPTQWKVEPV
jgi:acyl-CoA hydrolase